MENKGQFKKENIPWNKGKKTGIKPWLGKKRSEEDKKKFGPKKGKHYPKMSECKKGRTLTEKTKEKMSEAHIGEKSYLWDGGKSFEVYDKRFNNLFKRLVRKRDNQSCILCGVHREKLKRALDVHHIDYNKRLTVIQNCISLCQSCHNKTKFHKKQWKYFFQSLLFEKYNYQYEKGKIILEVKSSGYED